MWCISFSMRRVSLSKRKTREWLTVLKLVESILNAEVVVRGTSLASKVVLENFQWKQLRNCFLYWNVIFYPYYHTIVYVLYAHICFNERTLKNSKQLIYIYIFSFRFMVHNIWLWWDRRIKNRPLFLRNNWLQKSGKKKLNSNCHVKMLQHTSCLKQQ